MEFLSQFVDNIMSHSLMVVFLVAVIGYLIGSLKQRHEIGTAGVLLVALAFGHFGYSVPKEIQEMGLILFVTSVDSLQVRNFSETLR